MNAPVKYEYRIESRTNISGGGKRWSSWTYMAPVTGGENEAARELLRVWVESRSSIREFRLIRREVREGGVPLRFGWSVVQVQLPLWFSLREGEWV